MGIIIQNRRAAGAPAVKKKKRKNVDLQKAWNQYNSHMKKVNRRMHG